MNFIKKHAWPVIYTTILALFTLFVILDAFVIPQPYAAITTQHTAQASSLSGSSSASAAGTSSTASSAASVANAASASSSAEVSDNSYNDGNISIKITKYREYNSDIYAADIQLSNINYLKTALADDTFGRNITQTTSEIAAAHNAILAINGDFYGTRMQGYVIRNGTVYRDTSSNPPNEDLVIYSDGSCSIIEEGSISAADLIKKGALQVLSFGPALIKDGSINITENEEVGRAQASNPRTAIGMISPLHYIFVVSDGRSSASQGLSLYQLATFMKGLGVTTAYNLDGGGSSTMYFNGKVINNPTTNGRSFEEREVSDIVYVGY